MIVQTAESLPFSQAALQWKHIGIKNHHGILVPIFSLHTRKSCGIGEDPASNPPLNMV